MSQQSVNKYLGKMNEQLEKEIKSLKSSLKSAQNDNSELLSDKRLLEYQLKFNFATEILKVLFSAILGVGFGLIFTTGFNIYLAIGIAVFGLICYGLTMISHGKE